MMDLTKIDAAITEQLNVLKSQISKDDLKVRHTFKLSELNENLIIADKEFSGIYYFEIQNNGLHTNFESWLKSFKNIWNKAKYKGKKIPLLYPGRYNTHNGPIKPMDWIPLYIGKSKEVGHRVNQHLFLDIKSATYAMKLKAHKDLANETFRVSTLELDVFNYDTIAPVVEKKLRDLINPIIGKQ